MGKRRGEPTPLSTVRSNKRTVDLFCVLTVEANSPLDSLKDITKATADRILKQADTGVEVKAISVSGGIKLW